MSAPRFPSLESIRLTAERDRCRRIERAAVLIAAADVRGSGRWLDTVSGPGLDDIAEAAVALAARIVDLSATIAPADEQEYNE